MVAVVGCMVYMAEGKLGAATVARLLCVLLCMFLPVIDWLCLFCILPMGPRAHIGSLVVHVLHIMLHASEHVQTDCHCTAFEGLRRVAVTASRQCSS